jgi:hypothetical protein
MGVLISGLIMMERKKDKKSEEPCLCLNLEMEKEKENIPERVAGEDAIKNVGLWDGMMERHV